MGAVPCNQVARLYIPRNTATSWLYLAITSAAWVPETSATPTLACK